MSLQPDDFVGTWRISRVIEDALHKSAAQFDGQADITKGAQAWHYAETGQLRMTPSQSFTAERQYIWKPAGAAIDVYFEDGRYFHQIALTQDCGADNHAAHWCDPDHYEVSYTFVRWPKWQATWRVRGPRKNYTMTSIYTQR